MRAARSELNSVRGLLRQQIASIVSGIKHRYDITRTNEESVGRNLEKNKDQVQEIGRKQTRLRELEREVKSNRRLYNMFFKRYKEASEAADMKAANIHFIDFASVPNIPVKPKKRSFVMTSFAGSLFLGFVIAVLRERNDVTLSNSRAAEAALNVPVLGVVPYQKLARRDRQTITDVAKMIVVYPLSEFSEAIRTLRTNLVLSGLGEEQHTWLVTSTFPMEGKSTILMNLAFSLGSIGTGRILVVDADLRQPSLSARYNYLEPNSKGLTHYLGKIAHLDDCIHGVDDNIDVLPAGIIPANPQELITSPQFSRLLEELKTRYKFVLIDSPPVLSVSDSKVLAQHVHSVLYVVKAKETPISAIKEGFRRLDHFQAPLAGIVLNAVMEAENSEYGRGSNGRSGYVGFFKRTKRNFRPQRGAYGAKTSRGLKQDAGSIGDID
jgi:capsular exopolysaccharide synthesis family protein